MADGNKRYYWLKLPEDFFRHKEIKRLRKIAGGDTFTIIYLKMLLRSMEDDGKLYYEGYESDFVNELALDIDEEAENVEVTVKFLLANGILQENTISEYEITTVNEMVGSECASTRRSRKCRAAQEIQKKQNIALQCNTDATIRNTEKEKDKEKEIEKEGDKRKTDDVRRICEMLNAKAGTNYRPGTAATQKHINARLAEGFTVDDFQTVIDKKCAEWLGTDMEKYLRPETLFGSKFESYLNAPATRAKKSSNPFEDMIREQEERMRAVEVEAEVIP